MHKQHPKAILRMGEGAAQQGSNLVSKQDSNGNVHKTQTDQIYWCDMFNVLVLKRSAAPTH